MNGPGQKIRCTHCGGVYQYDEQRRCFACDDHACPHCLPDEPEALCPECRFGSLPAHLEPMLAVNGEMPEDPQRWVFEYKWDGMRTLCYWQSGQMRLETRSLRNVTAMYPDIMAESDQISAVDAIFDGEIVTPDEDGRPSFSMLQKRMFTSPRKAAQLAQSVPVQYYVFDLLWLDGRSLLDEPYAERRLLLEALSLEHERWRTPPAYAGEGGAMLEVARRWRLEGVIAKRPDSVYRPGQRSTNWLKVKIVHRQEFVIGGWEPRANAPRQVGSLLLGYFDEAVHGLRFVGRVGTGFNAVTHEKLVSLLQKHGRPESPFAGRAGKASTRFVAPKLVAEVAYRRWPEGGMVQQATFLGLRNDVQPQEIVVERSHAV